MASQLDALLSPAGYHCLHDCRWPGRPKANIDHVVIGPGGVFVIDDKCQKTEVSRSANGRYYSGRYPFEREISKAGEQAQAVAYAIGAVTETYLAIHLAGVRNGDEGSCSQGVWVYSARNVISAVQRRSRAITDATAAEFAARAVELLKPSSQTPAWQGPQAIPVPSTAPVRRGSRRPAPARSTPRQNSHARRPTRARRRPPIGRGREVLRGLLAIGLLWGLTHQIPKVFLDPPEGIAVATVVSHQKFNMGGESIESSFICQPPGLRHSVKASGFPVHTAEWARHEGGPWAVMVLADGAWTSPAEPAAPSWVRLNRASAGLPPDYAMFFDQAPSGEAITAKCT